MKLTKLFSPQEIAVSCNIHRTTVMRRFLEIGIEGTRLGPHPKSPIRYTEDDCLKLAKYLNLKTNDTNE